MNYWKKRCLEHMKFSRIVCVTMFLGIIINFTILSFTESSTYTGYLVMSLVGGFILSIIHYKLNPPVLTDDWGKEIPPEN
jgi:hypothetical protein